METSLHREHSRYWHELKSSDFPLQHAQAAVALLPVAAVEQHGAHLPLGTDALINAGVVAQAMHRHQGPAPLLVLPALDIGDSLEHSEYPGTLSVAAETLLAGWLDVARSVRRAGVLRLLVFNSHGGQNALVDLLALRLRVELRMLVARADWFAFGAPTGLFDSDELAHGLHGGETETSLMLCLHPELVDMESAENVRGLGHRWSEAGRMLGVEQPVGIGWMSQDLHPSGVCGNAAAADAVRGQALLEHLAACLARVAGELAETPLEVLQDGPLAR